VKAADFWRLALGTADEPDDAKLAQSTLQSLAPEIAKVEEEKRRAEMKRKAQAALDEAETALKASNFDLADAKYREAQGVLPTEAATGLVRSAEARKQKTFDDAIAEARDFQNRKEWQKAKIAVDRALQIRPSDEGARRLLAAIEPNLIPERIELTIGGSTMTFVRIRAGAFTMGDAEYSKIEWLKDCMPHDVTLTRDYWMLTTEVTQTVWEAVMASNPSKTRGANLPVESVSWLDCASFIEKLGAKVADQLGKRRIYLPTEAEWEYACRAGSKTTWHFGGDVGALGDYAWIESNSGGTSHAVAQKKPNAWGLFDMHGNVFEWCADWSEAFTASKAVDPTGPAQAPFKSSRGGGFSYKADFSRAGFRGKPTVIQKLDSLGLRILLK
jgi:formylglycine-generating enzyme required for sulfatase activity